MKPASLPGLDRLAVISPDFARAAARLGTAAWECPLRTPRETTSAFLGMDIALGALALPLTLHTAMARRLRVTDAYIIDVITRLAPAVGYPQAAQALLHIGLTPAPDQPDGAATARELDFGLRAAGQLLGTTATRGEPSDLHDIIAEYGTLRLPSAERTLRA